MFSHAWRWATGLSLVQGHLHVALVTGLAVGLGVLLLAHRGRRWALRRVPLALLAAAVLLGAAQLLLVLARPFPDGLPWLVPLFVGLGLAGVALAVAGWAGLRWRRRGVAVLAVLAVVLGAADGVDAVYRSFPTVASALQLPPYDQVPFARVATPGPAAPAAPADWTPPQDLPGTGALAQVTIPATASGFPARPAWVYVPPAYRTADRPLLPVWVLLSGQPGGTRDWIDGGQLAHRLDDWAAAHDGLAPVVVMPDALGGETDNPLCLDSALGRSATYLSVDVPAWIGSSLQVDPDHAHWAVGGLSYGGTCALQLAVAHPDLFPTFFDVSGQRGPTLGNPQDTVQATFDGDQAAFDAVDPLHELAARRYPQLSAYVAVGDDDDEYRPQAQEVAAALGAAGVSVTTALLPGAHSWGVWGPALQGALPWLTAHTGLPS